MEPNCKAGEIYFCSPFSPFPQLVASHSGPRCCCPAAGTPPQEEPPAGRGNPLRTPGPAFSCLPCLPSLLVLNEAGLGQALWRKAI